MYQASKGSDKRRQNRSVERGRGFIIMKNGGSYDIKGGILALKRAVDEEKKEKEKNSKET